VVALSDPLLVQLAWRLASRDVSALEPLPGGASSLTYVGRCADRPVVVKVAPPGVRPIAHRDVLRQARAIRALAATPPVSELATVYREELGREVPQLDWFQALACFKSAATWSLIVKHNRRRNPPDPDLEVMAAALPQLLSRAGDLLG
jgi:aminoglycoside phosphotransferase (APT) family kinase protein